MVYMCMYICDIVCISVTAEQQCKYSRITVFCFTVLMIITGAFVNAPYAMITTAVSADLVGLLACVHDQCSICMYVGTLTYYLDFDP